MTWIKLEDTFPDDPKVIGLPDSAFRMYVWGLCYCARHLTDGTIPRSALGLYPDSKRSRIGSRLVDAGLWERTEDGFEVCNYLRYQRSADQVKTERDQAKQRKAAQRSRQKSRRDVTPKSRRDTGNGHAVSHATRGEERQNPSSSPPHEAPLAPTSGAGSAGEEDHQRTLEATWERMATVDLRLAQDRGEPIHTPAAWKQADIERRRTAHHTRALEELQLHPNTGPDDLAEILDPTCGPDDGGRARALAAAERTRAMLHRQQ